MSKTKSALKSFSRLWEYKVLSNVKISFNGKETTLHNIMVGEFGVLVCAAFNEAGELYGNAGDNNFILIDRKNRRLEKENLCKKLEQDILILREIFAENKIYNTKIEKAIVIEHSKCKAMITDTNDVYSVKEFKKYISKVKFEMNNKVDKNAVCEAILKNKI